MKQELNEEMLERASGMLKAIAHPIRIAIINKLKNNKLTVTQIHQAFGLEQSTASHHLRILKDRDVVCCKKKGKETYYSLKHEKISSIIDCIRNCI